MLIAKEFVNVVLVEIQAVQDVAVTIAVSYAAEDNARDAQNQQ